MSHVGRCQMANMFLCVKRSLHSRDAYFHRIRVYALVSAHRRLIEAELEGLSEKQLDFHDTSPEKEWMWWSFRTQVSHIAWDALVFTKKRAGHLLWPMGDVPEPII